MAQTGTPDQGLESTSTTEQAGRSSSIVLVHPDDLNAVWDHIVEYIAKCAPHSEGELQVDDFYVAIRDGEMQLWILVDHSQPLCIAVTQIIPYPKKRVLRIIAMGGEPWQWKKHYQSALSRIEDFALEMGCTTLEAWTRRAFLKIMKDWKSSYSVITKDLKGRMH